MSYATNCLRWIFSPTIRLRVVDQTIFPFGSTCMLLPVIGPLRPADGGKVVNSWYLVSNCNQRRLAPTSDIQIESPAPRTGGPAWSRTPTFPWPGGRGNLVEPYVFGSKCPILS